MDGADCYGFVRIVIMQELGIELPSLDYDEQFPVAVYKRFKPLLNAEEMAIAFMSGGPFHDAHVGIYHEGYIINMTNHGVCSYPLGRVRKYISGFYAPLN